MFEFLHKRKNKEVEVATPQVNSEPFDKSQYVDRKVLLKWMDEQYSHVYGSQLREHEGARMILQSLKRFLSTL